MSERIDDSLVFQLKVTLNGSKPPIWRRVQVRGSITLPELHDVLQTVMGWYDCHLHCFALSGVEYGEPNPDWLTNLRDEKGIRLDRLIHNPKDRLRYEYDFGDNWIHTLLVEKVLAPDPAVDYPVVLAGKRHAPPEDVGGIWGYRGFLEALADPANPAYREHVEWYGPSFDPEAFDLEAINRALQYPRIHRRDLFSG